jgi:hypothetical protein
MDTRIHSLKELWLWCKDWYTNSSSTKLVMLCWFIWFVSLVIIASLKMTNPWGIVAILPSFYILGLSGLAVLNKDEYPNRILKIACHENVLITGWILIIFGFVMPTILSAITIYMTLHP